MDWTEVIPKEWGKVSLEEAYRKACEAFDSCANHLAFRRPQVKPPLYKVGDVVYIGGRAWKLKRRYDGDDRQFFAQEERTDGIEGSYYGEPVMEEWASPNPRIDQWRRSYREYCRRLLIWLEALVRASNTSAVIKAGEAHEAATRELTDEDRAWIKEHWDFDAEDYN